LKGGILRQLAAPGYSTCSLLGFFFVGEGLVWGTYSKFMTSQFRRRLYVFHIAVAGFYHYFRSYAFALRLLPPAQIRYLKEKVSIGNFDGVKSGRKKRECQV
jgi:hypothetical protein